MGPSIRLIPPIRESLNLEIDKLLVFSYFIVGEKIKIVLSMVKLLMLT